MQPRLLLLDEPLGPLDAELRRTLLERVVDVHRRLGLATIHVTHDPDEAAGDADRVLRLEGGRLVDERTSAGREVPR
jgi:ABC-type sulfate/molybdate transport systems ATPase subunit